MRLTAAADRERKQAATERLLDADVHLSSASGLCSQREREREVESSPRAAERETKAGGSSRGLTSTMLGKRIEGGGRLRRGRRGKQSEEFRERSRRTKKKTLSDGRKKKKPMRQRRKNAAPPEEEEASTDVPSPPSTSSGGSSSAAALASGLKYLVGEYFGGAKREMRESEKMVSRVSIAFFFFDLFLGTHDRKKEKKNEQNRAASQVATRAITFALNLLTTRLLSVDAYGVREGRG